MGDVGEGTPDVVVLTEMQRELPTQSLPSYVEASEAQNARCWLATAGALRWGRFFGGVAIAVRLGKGTLLAAEATKFYVVAAIRAHTGLAYVVGGVYIPPRVRPTHHVCTPQQLALRTVHNHDHHTHTPTLPSLWSCDYGIHIDISQSLSVGFRRR